MIAFLSSSMPPTAVYLVNPSLIALIASSLIFSGVSKSGSPAPNPTTSTPSAFSAFAFAVIASVADGFSLSARAASFIRVVTSYFLKSFFLSFFSTISGTISLAEPPRDIISLISDELICECGLSVTINIVSSSG